MSSDRRSIDEYDIIYDFEDSRVFEELNEYEDEEDAIEQLRGTISKGDCIYPGCSGEMVYVGHICFVCSTCGKSVHEDVYYRWAAGYTIEFED